MSPEYTVAARLSFHRADAAHDHGMAWASYKPQTPYAMEMFMIRTRYNRLAGLEHSHDRLRKSHAPGSSRRVDVLHNVPGMSIDGDHVHDLLPVSLGQLCPCHLNQPCQLFDLHLVVHLQHNESC